MTFASMKDQFAAKNAELLGLSVDSNPSHIAWIKSMDSFNWKGVRVNINFPIIADDFGMVARTYGMLMPSSSATKNGQKCLYDRPGRRCAGDYLLSAYNRPQY